MVLTRLIECEHGPPPITVSSAFQTLRYVCRFDKHRVRDPSYILSDTCGVCGGGETPPRWCVLRITIRAWSLFFFFSFSCHRASASDGNHTVLCRQLPSLATRQPQHQIRAPIKERSISRLCYSLLPRSQGLWSPLPARIPSVSWPARVPGGEVYSERKDTTSWLG